MALVIDLVRALREPEYRDEVSEELESDITEHVILEAADEIDRLRSLTAELAETLQGVRDDLSLVVAAHSLGADVNVKRAMSRIRATLSRARAKEDT